MYVIRIMTERQNESFSEFSLSILKSNREIHFTIPLLMIGQTDEKTF